MSTFYRIALYKSRCTLAFYRLVYDKFGFCKSVCVSTFYLSSIIDLLYVNLRISLLSIALLIRNSHYANQCVSTFYVIIYYLCYGKYVCPHLTSRLIWKHIIPIQVIRCNQLKMIKWFPMGGGISPLLDQLRQSKPISLKITPPQKCIFPYYQAVNIVGWPQNLQLKQFHFRPLIDKHHG